MGWPAACQLTQASSFFFTIHFQSTIYFAHDLPLGTMVKDIIEMFYIIQYSKYYMYHWKVLFKTKWIIYIHLCIHFLLVHLYTKCLWYECTYITEDVVTFNLLKKSFQARANAEKSLSKKIILASSLASIAVPIIFSCKV